MRLRTWFKIEIEANNQIKEKVIRLLQAEETLDIQNFYELGTGEATLYSGIEYSDLEVRIQKALTQVRESIHPEEFSVNITCRISENEKLFREKVFVYQSNVNSLGCTGNQMFYLSAKNLTEVAFHEAVLDDTEDSNYGLAKVLDWIIKDTNEYGLDISLLKQNREQIVAKYLAKYPDLPPCIIYLPIDLTDEDSSRFIEQLKTCM